MRRYSLPYLALLVLAIFVTQPFFGADLVPGVDGIFHINKAVVLEHLFGQGFLFPRWMPDMAQGYGYPHLNYYAPLIAYLLAGLHQLGLTYPTAYHVAMVLCVWLAGVGAYRLARDWWGEAGALVTGALYLTAPYAAFTVVSRGALAEAFGYAGLPLVFFTLQRALTASRAAKITIWDLLVPTAFAAVGLAHSPTSLIVAPFAAAYVCCLAWSQHDARKLFRGAVLLALGLGLSAFFWLPALCERHLVQMDKLLTIEPQTTFYTNFLKPAEIFALPTLVDPLLFNRASAKSVGLATLLIALLGVVVFAVKRRRTKSAGSASRDSTAPLIILFFLATGAVCCALPLSWARPVWDRIVLLQYFQYPWRFLGCAALSGAVLAGSAFGWKSRRSAWVLALIIALAALGNVYWWYPLQRESSDEIDIAGTLRYETKTGFIGCTCYSEYLPTAVTRFPSKSPVADALLAGKEPDYLTGLPAGSGLIVSSNSPLNYRASLTLARAAPITFNQFYFPGWRVFLDKQPVPIEPLPGSGLISFSAPAGQHDVQIVFGDTFIRRVGNGLSGATFFLLMILAVKLAYRFVATPAANSRESSALHLGAQTDEGSALVVLGVGIALNLLRFFIPGQFLLLTEQDAQRRASAVAETPLLLDFEGGLRLHGYDVAASTIRSRETTDVFLYFTARQPLKTDYQFALYLKDSHGYIWNNPNGKSAQWDAEPPQYRLWPTDKYIKWARQLEVYPDIPPGKYQLLGALFDLGAGKIPVSRLNSRGESEGVLFSLGEITVKRPFWRPLSHRGASDTTMGPLTLIGHDISQTVIEGGNSTLLSFSWYAAADMLEDYTARLELSGPASFGVDLEPVAGFPTSEWRVGDTWRGQYRLPIPDFLPAGEYELRLSLKGEDASATLSTLRVNAPQRIFDPLLDFEGGMRLHGYDVEANTLSSGETTDVALYFAAPLPLKSDYQFALYLKDSHGYIWNNSTGEPVRREAEPRGFALWPTNKYVKWARRLEIYPDIPPGKYQLFGTVFDSESRKPASMLNSRGESKGILFDLGEITIQRPPGRPAAHRRRASGKTIGPLTLSGYEISRTAIESGDSTLLSFSWHTAADLSEDYSARLELSGPASFSVDLEPVAGFPTNNWRAGDTWRGQYRLLIPAFLPAGKYQLRISLKGAGASAVLSTLHVNAPQRNFTRPEAGQSAQIEFPGIGSLTGYDLQREKDAINLRLIWLASATPAVSYKVFVHLTDADGRVRAQSDAVPVGWTRPTTGWLPGEYLEDRHVLRLPADLSPAGYSLLIGFYDPDTSSNVCASGADCDLALAQLTIP